MEIGNKLTHHYNLLSVKLLPPTQAGTEKGILSVPRIAGYKWVPARIGYF